MKCPHYIDFFYLFASKFPRLVILRVHSHGLVTIDLQCYEEDNIAELDNVGDFNKIHICYLKAITKRNIMWFNYNH